MLLEVLIGMLLFLIGIVGIIGLQAASAKNATDAKLRTEAVYLANDIIGRMWADAANLGAYVTPAGTPCDAAGTTRDRWICAVNATLPNSTGVDGPTIAVAGSTVTVTIFWRKDPNETRHQHSIVTDISFM